MPKWMLAGIVAATLATAPTWVLFETNKDLIAGAKISMEEAIKSATTAVPGKAAEADLGKEEGRTIWKIVVIDQNNKSRTIYVDAQTGVARMKK